MGVHTGARTTESSKRRYFLKTQNDSVSNIWQILSIFSNKDIMKSPVSKPHFCKNVIGLDWDILPKYQLYF